MFVMYTLLIVAATHNTVRFVLRDYRFRNPHIAMFYVLVYLVCILRIIWMILILMALEAVPHENNDQADGIFYTDIIATYLELLIGIQQIVSMIELYLMIKRTSFLVRIERDSALSQLQS